MPACPLPDCSCHRHLHTPVSGNLPAQAGIIGLFAGLLCYGIFGSSRFALVSPTSSSAVVLAAATLSLGGDNPGYRLMLASGLVAMTGLIFIIAALTRMGNVTDFIGKTGFARLHLRAGHRHYHQAADDCFEYPFLQKHLFAFMVDILKQANLWNIGCLVTTVLALIFLSLGEWLRRIKNGKYKNFPSGTLVIILGILASKWFDLPSMDIPNVGLIQLNLNNPTNSRPSLFRLGPAV